VTGVILSCWLTNVLTETVVAAMLDKLKDEKLYKGHEVTKLAPGKDGQGVNLTVRLTNEELNIHQFDHVICTVPLSTLRLIDLAECNLGYHKRTAMRIMHYDHSTKVSSGCSSQRAAAGKRDIT